YADGDYKRLASFAAELVEMNLPVMVTYGTAATRVLQGATKTIPIVVAAADDLVVAGIVTSLARPGGNITGLTLIDLDMSTKQLELLKAFAPGLARVAMVLNPGNPVNPTVFKRIEATAPALGVEAVALNRQRSKQSRPPLPTRHSKVPAPSSSPPMRSSPDK